MSFPRVANPSLVLLFVVTGCSTSLGPSDGTGATATDSTDLALVSSSAEVGVLRRGETLSMRSAGLGLAPDTIYRARVVAGGETLSETDVLSDARGDVLLAALMHDVGEEGSAQPGDRLAIELTSSFGELIAETDVYLHAPPLLQVPGWNVEEVQPPHIFAADATGAPQNAFAVGGADEGEVVGPVHVAGEGFPDSVAGGLVHVYVMRDADEWRGRAIPTSGERYVAGPIEVSVNEFGQLAPTPVLSPDLEAVGIYDILVDLDRDGRFEWSFDLKDGADGLGKVGFTVQYSQAWLRERTSRHILVNIAYDSHERGAGTWRNEFASGEPVFLYLNPPVMHTYHFAVTKAIVRHQDFETYWNNPAMVDPSCGGVPYTPFESRSMAVVTERGCTNTSPTCVGPLDLLEEEGGMAEEAMTYDAVFDRDDDGCYDIGEDLLDIVSIEGGDLVPVEYFMGLPAEQRVGFRVSR